ncbi:hypothetical protein ACFQ4M_10680 [Thauera mechernichensis]|uniref:Uncharacterized protein n=1 Tax=Thauera mechernichensis TaxID=82788 RepID=A0ABW3WDI6_9RHOO|nr:hypothetical protein [Thauera mechernichensis]MDG3066176.1 hypothetical protein [Thauera mechernichensis]
MSPKVLKIVAALSIVVGFLIALPLNNRLLLVGILLVPILKLIDDVGKRDSLFLLNLSGEDPYAIITHPWIVIIVIVAIWYFGNS